LKNIITTAITGNDARAIFEKFVGVIPSVHNPNVGS
jgi:hypothetical protein